MRQFELAEAQERFEELVEAAEGGEVIGMLRDGKLVALLVPINYQANPARP